MTRTVCARLVLIALVAIGGCVWRPPATPWVGDVVHPVPVRFLLTFDDGPSGAAEDNPTASILDQLAANPVQKGVKALFFVQTRNPEGGASGVGRELLGRAHAEGHVLGLHSGSARGHIKHVDFPPHELDQSLADGAADLRALTGAPWLFLRPPNWAHNDAVLAAYREHRFGMLLDDVRARDGKHWGFKWNPRLHSHIHSEMAAVAEQIRAGELPALGGAIPVIVTLHDLNTATAGNLREYMQALMEGARRSGLRVDAKPFFDSRAEVERVARLRADPAAP
ncbi:MAG: polysaccharide deacetylase family protein [Gammaproteobacteria bacterium]|nr:polysaccharide deacetylase family protein [Gammaproteobacteria bacterium]